MAPTSTKRAKMLRQLREEVQRRDRLEQVEAARSEKVLDVAIDLMLDEEVIDAIFSGHFRAERLRYVVLAPDFETYDIISDLLSLAEAFSVFTQIVAKLWGEKYPALIPAMLDFQSCMLRQGRLLDGATVLDFAMQKMDRNMKLTKLTDPTCWMFPLRELEEFYYAPGRVTNHQGTISRNDHRPKPRKRRAQRTSNESRRRRKDRRL